MITGKQRSFLKSLAHGMEPSVIIGKTGITDNLIQQIHEVLEKREIVKIKILNNNNDDRETLIQEILQRLQCEFIQSIGNILVIYRESEKKIITLP